MVGWDGMGCQYMKFGIRNSWQPALLEIYLGKCNVEFKLFKIRIEILNWSLKSEKEIKQNSFIIKKD